MKQPMNFSEGAALQTFTVGHQRIALFVPDAAAVQAAYKSGAIAFPYWSQVWPSAEALALFITGHPYFTAGKKVVELGAGLGLPSVVAANNAAMVLCTDSAAEAVALVELTASHLALTNLSTAVIAWQQVPPALAADVLLLSDVNYEPAAFDTLLTLLQRFMAEGTTVLLSTPQRLLAKGFIEPLLPWCIKQEEVAVKNVVITVMVLQKRK